MGQFARFLLVGVGNTVISFVAYRILLGLGTPYVLAAALGFSVGAVNGYVFNRRWTFRARDSARSLAAIPPVTLCMFMANRVSTFADRG